MADDVTLYRALVRIRRFEDTVLDRFPTGVFYGTTHTCLGQEANGAGVLAHVTTRDVVVSNHRCHGHFLAYGGDMRALFAELMGRSTGVVGGLGGSQHLQWEGFYSNGILGSTLPVATGMALAEKRKGTGAVAVIFLGDGALGEGTVYEALNMAALWGAPILYVVEHNHVAQTTPTVLQLAGKIEGRFEAFGIPVEAHDTSDVRVIHDAAAGLLTRVRAGDGPHALVVDTRRFGPHSKGDDPRSPEEIAELRATRDPLPIHGARLDDAVRAAVDAEVESEVLAAFEAALADPHAAVAV